MSAGTNSQVSTPEANGSFPVAKFLCHTETQIIECHYTWVISNFTYLHRQIFTPQFSSESDRTLKFKLQLDPNGNGNDGENKGFVSLYLHLLGNVGDPQVQVGCTFFILDATNQQKQTHSFQQKMDRGSDLGYSRFIQRAKLEDKNNKYLVNGKLTLQCIIKASTDVIKSNQTTFRSSHDAAISQSKKGFEKLFLSGDSSDFKLKVKDREFHVHRAILASQSPVFAAMLKSRMKEDKDNEVIINDFDSDVIEEVVRFMYCGECKNLAKLAKNIIPIAEQYYLPDLKMLCEESINDNLKIDDAADVLDLADLYNCAYLKSNTLVFMSAHLNEIKLTAGYQNLKKFKPSLLFELHNF